MRETDGAPEAPAGQDGETVREQLERLRDAVSALVAREAQLAVAQHRTQLRLRAADLAGAVAVALTLLTAFGLVNAAAVSGQSAAMPAWAATLVLAALWIVVAALLAFALKMWADRGEGWAWWRILTGGGPGERERLEAARSRAESSRSPWRCPAAAWSTRSGTSSSRRGDGG